MGEKQQQAVPPLGALLIAIVEAQPDIPVPALAARLEDEWGVKADPSNLSKLLCREGDSYKKTLLAWGKERTDIREAHRVRVALLSPAGNAA